MHSKEQYTLGIKATIAFLGENFVLDWLDPALNINGPNSTHGEKRLGNLLVELRGVMHQKPTYD